jgi:hypothetical protein
MMVATTAPHISRTVPDICAAYGLAGFAVVAAHFGMRFGILSLARPFTLDPAHPPDRSRLRTLLYAGHAAERTFCGDRRKPLLADRSVQFLGLRAALTGYTGELDTHEERSARLAALAVVRLPANRAAIESLGVALAAGEMLGYLTARRMIRAHTD